MKGVRAEPHIGWLKLLHDPSGVRYLWWKHKSEQFKIRLWAVHPDKFASRRICSGETNPLNSYFSLMSFNIKPESTFLWINSRATSKISADLAISRASADGKRNKARRSAGDLGSKFSSFSLVLWIALLTSDRAFSIDSKTNRSPSNIWFFEPEKKNIGNIFQKKGMFFSTIFILPHFVNMLFSL